MRVRDSIAAFWRRLGWLTLLAFTLKGLITTSVIVWGVTAATQSACTQIPR